MVVVVSFQLVPSHCHVSAKAFVPVHPPNITIRLTAQPPAPSQDSNPEHMMHAWPPAPHAAAPVPTTHWFAVEQHPEQVVWQLPASAGGRDDSAGASTWA